jgi:ADP-heptose:LPS heptosyltransferase
MTVWRHLFRRSFDRALILYRDRRYRILTWPCKIGRIDQLTRRGVNRDVAQINEMAALFSQHQSSIVWPEIEKRCHKETILLALGGENSHEKGMHLRSWSAKNYAQLAKKLVEKGYSVTVTGRHEDLIYRDLFKGPKIENLIGKTSLKELTHLIAACRAVVTHDGGSLHLAQMSQTPTLALFGPTNPKEFIVSPFVKVLWEKERLECSPCYNGSQCGPCINNSCMKLLTPDAVCAALLSMIG